MPPPCLICRQRLHNEDYTITVCSNKTCCFFLKPPGGFIKGQHHPKSVFNLGPKVGPGLNKKQDFHLVFYSGFPLPNGKQQNPKGRRAKRAAPLGRRRRRRLVVPQTLLAKWGPGGKNKISVKVLPGSGHARCLCFTTLSAPRACFVSTKRRTTS